MNQAVESYEKQSARDKMIIKFREERIQRLEQKQPLNPSEKDSFIQQLKAENQQIKDQIEHNPMCAKLFAENAEL